MQIKQTIIKQLNKRIHRHGGHKANVVHCTRKCEAQHGWRQDRCRSNKSWLGQRMISYRNHGCNARKIAVLPSHLHGASETMQAYRMLGTSVGLEQLKAEEKKQKSHRVVLDTADGQLKLKANMPMSEEDKKRAIALEVRRQTAAWKEEQEGDFKRELQAERLRRMRHKRKTAALKLQQEVQGIEANEPSKQWVELEETYDDFYVLV